MKLVRFAVIALLGSSGCNQYDLFRLAGYQQESFTNSADVLFVIDNSDSMLEETASLAENFAGFVQNIAATEAAVGGNSGLPDAVDNYVHFVQDRSAFVDFQFGVTTTDAQQDKGEALGTGVVPRSDPDLTTHFIDNILCDATCFEGTPLPTDPDYECGQPLNGSVSEEYVGCACGGDWQTSSNCGSSDEAGLEAVFLAMCRAVAAPPTICFEDYIDADGNTVPAPLDEGDILSNEGLLREGANFVPVVISDEGDGSNRVPHGDAVPDEYVALFDQFNVRMTWVTIGPTLDEANQIVCPSSGSDFGVARYAYMSHITDGRFVPIDVVPACITRDFEGPLNELGDLLNNLLTVFPLQSVPVPGTLTAVIDGKTIDESVSTGFDAFGLETFSDGWTYRTIDNSVEFHGSAIPTYNANVQIFYLPIDGMPRELPF